MAVSNEFPGAELPGAERPDPVDRLPSGWRPSLAQSGLVGVIALGLTLAVAELLAALGQLVGWLSPASSPLSALGQSFIGLTPEWLKQFAISTFGSNDKTALMVGMGLTLLLVGVVIGLVGRDRPRIAVGLAVVLLVVTGAAVLSRPDATVVDLLPLALGGAAGIGFLVSAFRRQLAPATPAAEPSVEPVADAQPTGTTGDHHPMLRATPVGPAAATRRDFFRFAGIGALAAVAVGAVARWIPSTAQVAASRSAVALPAATAGTAAAPTDVLDDVPGISPFVTPNTDFYRIDTAFVVPRMTTDQWQLRVHGMVDREITLSWSDLLAMPSLTHMVTLTCVSNPVGGEYIGNADWQGVRIADVLAMAGPQAGADCVFSTSVDGFTVTTPLDVLTDDRDALLAYAMNGEPLPVEHGFPVRMVVPGLYGFVSATKWVVDLEVTTFADATAYWTVRGWSAKAPIKTSSRIDVPRSQESVSKGKVPIAGVAWAQYRGISGVQVQIDDGPWMDATLSGDAGADTWRQWVYYWDATASGTHTARCRATDATGAVQIDAIADVVPDGATGLDERTFMVTA
ncbi:molybdopterin-dependent oxidoreductase [Nakamurella multipartita]|uniref:Oxidoreductase molybdopterin binding n=1 Tax=Nakamurella multipartita (strain ATCC 700099 / DSM 44233 / CIP 104796 / JCM 9543 / NBRC 105858 / Y-104) TaxID=479431 RepID=C8XB73_NAKMY|nr:molybdopterin-dependent oxidoreductase [Nakamurella multipartita]ACV81365.1 oxidoreductase molybdopterin binding [Nakamurella multipartita DSM 44233]